MDLASLEASLLAPQAVSVGASTSNSANQIVTTSQTNPSSKPLPALATISPWMQLLQYRPFVLKLLDTAELAEFAARTRRLLTEAGDGSNAVQAGMPRLAELPTLSPPQQRDRMWAIFDYLSKCACPDDGAAAPESESTLLSRIRSCLRACLVKDGVVVTAGLLSANQLASLYGRLADADNAAAHSVSASSAAKAGASVTSATATAVVPAVSPHPEIDASVSSWIEGYYHRMRPGDEDIDVRRQALLEMQRVIRSEVLPRSAHLDGHSFYAASVRADLPSPVLEVFGSSGNGFGSATSDIDAVLTMHPDTAYHLNGKDGVYRKLLRLFRYRRPRGWSDVLCIPTAAVPIIRAIHDRTGVQVDICIGNELALHNTRLLALYAELHPCVRPLGFVVKAWAKQRSINDASQRTLSSYAWICLLVFFLQRCGVLPCLQDDALVREYEASTGRRAADRVIAGWRHRYVDDVEWLRKYVALNSARKQPAADAAQCFEFSSSRQSGRSDASSLEQHPSNLSPAQLLCAFFCYYTHVAVPDGLAISIRTGAFQPRMCCADARPLSSSDARGAGAEPHPAPADDGEGFEPGDGDGRDDDDEDEEGGSPAARGRPPPAWRLVIEDPFELNHDLGRVMDEGGGLRVRHELQRAWQVCRSCGAGAPTTTSGSGTASGAGAQPVPSSQSSASASSPSSPPFIASLLTPSTPQDTRRLEGSKEYKTAIAIMRHQSLAARGPGKRQAKDQQRRHDRAAALMDPTIRENFKSLLRFVGASDAGDASTVEDAASSRPTPAPRTLPAPTRAASATASSAAAPAGSGMVPMGQRANPQITDAAPAPFPIIRRDAAPPPPSASSRRIVFTNPDHAAADGSGGDHDEDGGTTGLAAAFAASTPPPAAVASGGRGRGAYRGRGHQRGRGGAAAT